MRGIGTALPAGGAPTPNFTWQGGQGTVPCAPGQAAGADVPGTYADRAFTIAPGAANGSATRGKSVGDGYYFVRYTLREANGVADIRRLGSSSASRRRTGRRTRSTG